MTETQRRPNVTGAWFPSGFYGHFRSVPRNDIYEQFRQLAKPQPPVAFLNRIKERPNKHIFSTHDNRFSYITDATYLDMGVGKKRRLANSTFNSNPHLLEWRPEEHGHGVPATSKLNASMYESAYSRRGSEHRIIIPNLRVLQSSNPSPLDQKTTSYRYAFGNLNPDRAYIRELHGNALHAKPSQNSVTKERVMQQRRCKTSFEMSGNLSESVANCMVWHEHLASPTAPTIASEAPV